MTVADSRAQRRSDADAAARAKLVVARAELAAAKRDRLAAAKLGGKRFWGVHLAMIMRHVMDGVPRFEAADRTHDRALATLYSMGIPITHAFPRHSTACIVKQALVSAQALREAGPVPRSEGWWLAVFLDAVPLVMNGQSPGEAIARAEAAVWGLPRHRWKPYTDDEALARILDQVCAASLETVWSELRRRPPDPDATPAQRRLERDEDVWQRIVESPSVWTKLFP